MVNRILGGIGRSLIFAGVVVLLFVGYQLWGTGLDEAHHQDDLTLELGESLGLAGEELPEGTDPETAAEEITDQLAEIDPTTAPAAVAPAEGEAGGLIEIPKINLRTKAFVEGVAKADLRKGPGHYPGTPLPGNPGNSGIAGHRSTYGAPFNRLDELVPGDEIKVYTPQGEFVYEVLVSPEERRSGPEDKNWGQGWFAVNPNDVSVLNPSDENLLTLTACHPKYSAKLRIIVVAKLVAQPAEAPETTTTVPTTDPADDAGQTIGETDADAFEDLIAGDSSELKPSMLFGVVVIAIWLLAMVLAALLRRRFKRVWPIYIPTLILSAIPLWYCFVHLDRFLPSI